MSGFWVSDRPTSTGALAVYPYATDLLSKFSYIDRFDNEIRLWEVRGGRVYVPRAVCPLGENDERLDGVPEHIVSRFKPRNEDQVRVVQEAVGLLEAGESFVLQCPTGWGKTPLACHLIAHISRRTMIIVHKQDMVKDWRDQLVANTSLSLREIGLVQQDTIDVAGKPVVIGMLQSLSKKGRYPTHLWSQFGFLINDEVHRVPTDQFTEVLKLFPARLRVGLSATPQRRDGRDRTVRAHIGPVRVKSTFRQMTPRIFCYMSDWKCPIRPVEDGSGKIEWKKAPHEPGRAGHILSHLVKHSSRNELITEVISVAYRSGRIIAVFSERRGHLQELKKLLHASGVSRKDVAYYWGGLTDEERDIAKSKQVLLCTYKMADEATNIPWLDCCVLATPRASVEQAVGRILREYPDKKDPVVFDFADDDSYVYKSYRTKRLSWYRRINAKIEV